MLLSVPWKISKNVHDSLPGKKKIVFLSIWKILILYLIKGQGAHMSLFVSSRKTPDG